MKEREDRTVLVEANQHATLNTRITRFLTTVYKGALSLDARLYGRREIEVNGNGS